MIHFLDPVTDKLIGYLDGSEEKNFMDDVHEQDVEGLNIFTFSAPAGLPEMADVENLVRIIIPHDKEGWQEFIAYQGTGNKRRKTITAVGSEVELDKLKTVAPNRHESQQLRYYINLGVDGVEWQVGEVVSSGLKTLTFEEPLGGHEYLLRVAGQFEVELVFRILLQEGEVVARYVDAVPRIGSENSGKEFINAKDLVDVRKIVNTERFITALWVYGPDLPDGTPREPKLVVDDAAFQRWNRKGQHRYGRHKVESTDEEMTDARIITLGTTELKKRIAAVVTYEIDAADLAPHLPHEAAYLGDTVTIKDEDFNPPLFATARIINMKRRIKRQDEERVAIKELKIGEVSPQSTQDMQDQLAAMKARFEELVTAAEAKAADAAARADGILDSEAFKNLLGSKADAEAIGNLVSKDELQQQDEAQAARVLEAIRNMDLSHLQSKDEAAAEAEAIKEAAAASTGYNLLRNSVGYGGILGWTLGLNVTGISSVMNASLERIGFGSGFHFEPGGGVKTMEQAVNVIPGQPLTLSWFLQKTQPGAFTIEILENAVVKVTVPDIASPTFDFTSSYIPYVPDGNVVTVRFTVADTTDATITGIMLGEGPLPQRWTLASGELYNAFVRVDDTGLSVYRVDEDGQIEGFTNVSPTEFAIYFDENGNGDNERVFWFSKDETNTKKIRVREEILMGNTKMVVVKSATNSGIAFVPAVPAP